MTNRRSRPSLNDNLPNRSTRKDKLRQRLREAERRKLLLEMLEDRRLMAVGPRLAGIQPTDGTLLSTTQTDVRSIAPRDLKINFDESQVIDSSTLSGIRVVGAGGDGTFNDGNEIVIQPGFIGVNKAPQQNEVVVRFAETLTDDLYRVEIFSKDVGALGVTALRNSRGQAFVPSKVGADRQVVNFELDLAPQVVAVVPQPVRRNLQGGLTQDRNTIEVYFNNDKLLTKNDDVGNPTFDSAENPDFYQLIYTNDSVRNTDDVVIKPASVKYNRNGNLATLTFAQDLDQLVDPNTGGRIGPGTFRLRIGTNEAAPLPPLALAPVLEITSDLNTADAVAMQFTAVRSGENNIAIVVSKHDLGGSSRSPIVNVVGTRVLVDMNSRAGSETRAVDFAAAINAHPVARTLITAGVNSGDPNTILGNRPINYSPLTFTGLGSSYETATNLTDDTDLGPVIVISGNGGTFIDGAFFKITDTNSVTRTFEFDSDVPAVLNDRNAIGISFSDRLTQSEMANLIRDAINGGSFGVRGSLAGNSIRLEGELSVDLSSGVVGIEKVHQNMFDSGLSISVLSGGDSLAEGQTFAVQEASGPNRTFEFDIGYTLTLVAAGGAAISDGQVFSISDGLRTVTFEFEDATVTPGVTGTNIPVPFASTDSRDVLAGRIIALIANEVSLANVTGVRPFNLGRGQIHLGGVTGNAVDISNVPGLSLSGQPGTTTAGAVAVPVVPHASFTSNDVARAVAAAISSSGGSLSAVASGSRVRLNGDRDVVIGAGVTALSTSIQGRFDTGPVLQVTTTASGIGDGQSITIRDDRGVSHVFEFNKNGILNEPTALSVNLIGNETAREVAQILASSINLAGFRVRATAFNATIYLTNDRDVFLDPALRAISATSQGVVISSEIGPGSFDLDLPGGNDDPGHRDIPEEVGGAAEQHINTRFGGQGRDVKPGATTIFYNFRSDYGVDPQGSTLFNAITPEQRQRAREAFELWSEYLGVQFLESEREGLTIATGDLRALNITQSDVLNYPSFNFRVRIDPKFARGLLVQDSSVQWNDDFGNAWFRSAMVGIGSMLGLERANDLPRSTIMAFTSNFSFPNAPTPEPIFPGNHDITHGQHLYRPDGTDIDLYQFTIDLENGKAGILTAETFAERQPNSSLLDTVISLYRENSDGTRELIGRNDDYYGRDSFVEVTLGAGTYYIGVSATGNTKFDPTIDGTGFGGRNQGPYDLRMNFRSQVDDTDAIRDEDLQPTVLDGDGDGVPGGVYNFWFQAASLNRVLEVRGDGRSFRDGQVLTLTSHQGVVRRFEFDNDNSVAAGNIRVAFGPTTTSGQMATTLANAILGTGIGISAISNGNHITLDGDRVVSLSPGFSGLEVHGKTIFVDKNAGPNADGSLGRPFNNIARTGFTNAFAATHPGDIVRVVGNGGADGDISTLRDNVPYEFGFSTLAGQILTDGTEMAVPKGVTVMVEPGAIFKLRRSWLGVGSSSLLVDRSAGALQVLGTPKNNVHFTSWLDESLGRDTHPPVTVPARGDWGGFIFRNDVDAQEARPNLEGEGIFLNYVNHAQVLYGGSGDVLIDSQQQIVNPIQIVQTRPTISHNLIRFSADSALSATPDSFDETNFHTPEFQSAGRFTSDYSRVGPEFNNNRLIDNSTNGLFIRIETPAGNSLQPLTVPGRFDDTDVVHVVAENLVIRGSESAPFLDLSRPQVNLITYSPLTGGSLIAGTYNYKLTFVDRNGFESRPSKATPNIAIAGSTGSIQLNQLPPTSGEFVARRIYRTSGTALGVYTLVAEIDASDTVYVDSGSNLSAILQRDPPEVESVQLAPRPRGSLDKGIYNYRLVFVDANGREGASSDATVSISIDGAPTQGGIALTGLPAATSGFVSRRLYRSTVGAISPYVLVSELDATSSTYIDDGFTVGTELNASAFGVIRARPSARLRIDPGTVVKLEGGRIEATFGAQLIAEGRDGQEVIFTSRIDDKYGAGGTFDTNNDNRQTPSESQPQPGDWSGLYFGHLSSASIDHAVISFAGGINRLSGTFVGFNPVEIHQSDVRITNTTIEENELGIGGQGPFDRFGRGYNRPAVIFARGAQPILLNNIIRDNFLPGATAANSIAAITINANSLTHELITDTGRETGFIDRTDHYADNRGPLIRGNRFDNNGLNGLVIRGEELTTQSVWDDTDVVHILTNRYDRAPVTETDFQTLAFDEIIIPEFHSFGGLRLQSSPSESLVIKLEGSGNVNNGANVNPTNGAGFTATGRRLGQTDRIGGTIAVVGQPGFPVVLTSIHDDSVGAGVRPDDKPQSDTNNNGIGSIPRANDWRSVRMDQFSNDRNVELVLELERADETAPGVNATANTAQNLGTLAASESASDDNRRLGFEIQGLLNDPADIDVYSFRGTAGTEVWVDLDRTTFSLDTVIELLDASGNVLARSDDTLRETSEVDFVSPTLSANLVNPLQKSPSPHYPEHFSGLPKDFYSTNPRDAGMRISLPGVAGAENNYHLRVRSRNGLTTGVYQMQIRIRENDEFPGSTVRYADIRYANSGIEVVGLPKHSPFLGEAQEDEETGGAATNNTVTESPTVPGNRPQNLGNLLSSDRGALSVAGSLLGSQDIDFYRFGVAYDAVTSTTTHHAGMVFDVDYADSLLRPNTIVSVFDSSGRLVLIGRDSNIAEDRPGPLAGADLSDFSRGSVGPADPFIGPVQVPQGDYFVAVTSNAFAPTVLNNSSVRLEPLNTVRRIAEDHIGSSERGTFEPPVVPVLFDPSFVGTGTNLWHVTTNRANDAGHGLPPVFDGSRTTVAAGASFRFGRPVGGVSAGAIGSLSSNQFSLQGYSAADLPLVYFNYFTDSPSSQRFRAVILNESGASTVIASNNPAEVSGPGLLTPFGWRQARIPLDAFVGQRNLRLRFDVDATAPGASGNEGPYVDDIIIGFAERGEMVSFAPADTTFAFNPGSTANQILSGDYQLEMRRASEFGRSTNVGNVSLVLTDTIDTNDRLTEQTTLIAPNGSQVVEGQTFVVSDGVNSVTFEYEDPEIGNGVAAGNVEIRFKSFSAALGLFQFDPDVVIARRIRDAINSPQVQTTLKLRAGLSEGLITGTTGADARVNLYGSAIVEVPRSFEVVDTTNDGNALRDAIVGSGIRTVGNATFVGSDTSAGRFVGGGKLLNMQSGILLTTGDARAANGPNFSDTFTGHASLSGDATLDTAFGTTTTDSSSLEFQFQFGDGSLGGDLHLNFLFASEEYNERVGTSFSDALAIFVDGVNIAVVPNTTDRVSIDTINGGNPFNPSDASGQNAALFVNNDPNDQGKFLGQFGYDGFTQRLTASALGLGVGPHTIKIVISDVGDAGGDSAIFVESGSLGTTPFTRASEGIEIIRHTGFGDQNHFRDQGQTLIHSNSIRDTLTYGIVATSGLRDSDETPVTPFNNAVRYLNPSPGPVRNLSTANNVPASGGFAPGIVIANNTISDFGVVGVHVAGNSRTLELTPAFDTSDTVTSGDSFCDGDQFIVSAYGNQVLFEFEDIGGGATGNCGSGVGGGNGWTTGAVPVFYRQTGAQYAIRYVGQGQLLEGGARGTGYSQSEMAHAINDAIESSILVQNGTRQVIEANVGESRLRGVGGSFGRVALASTLEHVASVAPVPRGLTVRQVSLATAPQTFARVVNNTIYGSDGVVSRFPESIAEPNDTILNAIDTRQGRQANPDTYTASGQIGDGQNFRLDSSLDVDVYQFQLDVGDRVRIDVDVQGLDSLLRLFNSVGEEVAFSDNNLAPGESAPGGIRESYIDFTARASGTYYAAVSGRGNRNYSPSSLANRTGPASQGTYQVNINVDHPRQAVITVNDPATYADGQTFRIYQIPDLPNQSVNFVTFEFDNNGAVTQGNVPIALPASGVGNRHPELAVNMANAINNSPLLNLQNLPNAPFANANPIGRVTAEAVGGLGRGQRNVEQFNGLDHVESGVIASLERFVLVRNLAYIEDVNSGLAFTPNPTGTNFNQESLPTTRERGILVSEQATPTLLNNIVANTGFGILQGQFQAGSSGPVDNPPGIVGVMVEGGSLFQHNADGNSNIPRSGTDFQIVLGNLDPLFVNAANGEFYPAPGSQAIDSAVDSLEERAAFRSIKTSAGIALSPIRSPDRDQSGQLRKDDPNVFTPSGIGANVFKDRGSLDRADFVGPSANLINPLDNDVNQNDLDAAVSVVQLSSGVFTHFSIQLVDGFEAADPFPGVGLDDSTVSGRTVTVEEDGISLNLNGAAITIFEDGRFLQEGVDYTFRFDTTSNTIRLSPLAGIWPNDKVYVIGINNRDRFVIDAPSGLGPTDADMFTITNAEGDTATFEYDSGYIVRVSPTLALQVPAQGAGTGGITDGQRFSIDTGKNTVVFELDRNNNVLPGSRAVPFTANDSADQIAASIVAAINQAVAAGALPALAPKVVPGGIVHVGATPETLVSVAGSSLVRNIVQFPTGLVVPKAGGAAITEGEVFRLRNGATTVAFEFDIDGGVIFGNRPVPFTAGDTVDQVVNAIVAAISNAQAAGAQLALSPFNDGKGRVVLGAGQNHTVDVSQTVLQRTVAIGGIGDGETFFVQNGQNPLVRFEFDNDGTFVDANGNNIPDNQLITFSNADTHEDIGRRVANTLANVNLNLTPSHYGDGNVHVGGTVNHVVNVGNSPGLVLLGRPGVRPSTTLQIPRSLGIRVPVGANNLIVDGSTFSLTDGTRTVVFEFDSDGVAIPGNRVLVYSSTSTVEAIASAIAAEITSANIGLAATNLGNGLVNLNSTPNYSLNLSGTPLVPEGFVSGLNDGDRFSIDAGNTVVTFEFEDSALNNGVTGGSVGILFRNGDLVDTVANGMAAAIQSAELNLPNVTNLGNGVVRLFDSTRHITRVVRGNIQLSGVAGASVAINYEPGMTDDLVASAIADAINRGQLTGATSNIRGGSTLFVNISDARGRQADFVNSQAAIAGIPSFFLSAVQDIPGNTLKANQVTNETQFVILMPGVELDFGDAADPFAGPGRYPTLFDNNGARHVITDSQLRLGSRVDADPNGQPTAAGDGDDADHILDLGGTPLTAESLAPFTIQVPAAGGAAFVDGTTFQLTRTGFAPITFEFDNNNAFNPASIAIPFANSDTADALARSIATAVANSNVALQAVSLGGGAVFLGGRSAHSINTSRSTLKTQGFPPNQLIIPAGGGSSIFDNQSVVIFDGINRLTIEFDTNGSGGTIAGSVVIPVTSATTSRQIADAIKSRVSAAGLNIQLSNIGPDGLGNELLHVAGVASHAVNLTGSPLTFTGRTPTALTIPGAGLAVAIPTRLQMRVPNTGGSGINDGDRFVIADGLNAPVTFEFDRGGGVQTGTRRVVFGLSHSADTVASSMVTAIQDAISEGLLVNTMPVNLGGGLVDLGGTIFHTLNTSLSTLSQIGPIADGNLFTLNDGVHPAITFEFDLVGSGAVTAGNRPVPFRRSDSTDTIANAIVTAIKDRVSANQLQGIDPVNVGGGIVDMRASAGVQVSFAGTPGVSLAGTTGGVSDGQTFTIDDGNRVFTFEFDRNGKSTLGNVVVPFSSVDTPATISATLASVIQSAGVHLTASSVGAGIVRLEGPDDDGVSFDGILSPGKTTPITVNASAPGVLNGWMDFNQDGDWDDPNENILNNVRLVAGSNRLNISVPDLSPPPSTLPLGNTFARFRFSSTGNLLPTGLAVDGEVEDYRVRILSNESPTVVPPGIVDQIVIEDAADTQILLTNAFDDPDLHNGNGDILAYTVVDNDNPSLVAVRVATDGRTLILDYQDNANGTANVRIRATDQGDVFVEQPFLVHVLPVNDIPLAIGETLTTPEDQALNITLRADDGDLEVVQALLFAVDIGPANGTLTQFEPATGRVRYTPNANFNGVDTVVFSVIDDGTAGGAPRSSQRETLTISVQSVNDAPVANDQSVTATEDTNRTITLTGSDGDPERVQTLTFAVASNPLQGTIVSIDAATGEVLYRPNSNFVGVDTFTFRVTDDGTAGAPASLASLPGTVTITITPVNDPPIANNLVANVTEDIPTAITFAVDDGDPEVVQSLTFAIVSQPTRGTLTGLNVSTGVVTYTPQPGFNGTDSFTYRVVSDDGTAGNPANLASNVATVTITVFPVNDAPNAVGQTLNVNEDGQIPFILTGDDGDPELNQILTFALASQPANGTLFGFNPATGQVTYRPNANFNGVDTFTFTVRDNGIPNLTSAPGTVTISVAAINDVPVANLNVLAINEDSPTTITLTGNDGDPERSQALTFVLSTQPSRGILSAFNPATGQVTYTPNADFNGIDSFSFSVTDDGTAGGSALTSAAAVVSINIAPLNDAPQFTRGTNPSINEDAGPQTILGWASAVRAGPASAADETSQIVSFILTNNNHGLFATQPSLASNGTLIFTPADNRNGVAVVTLRAIDNGPSNAPNVNESAPQTFTITVNSVNDAPEFLRGPNRNLNEDAGPQSIPNWATNITPGPASAADEASQTVSFLVNSSNTAIFAAQPAIASDGTLTFTPAQDANGTAIVTVRAQDSGPGGLPNSNTSVAQTFTIAISPINDSPEFTAGSNPVVNEDAGDVVINNWATGIRPGPASATDENSQQLQFLFNLISTTGTLAFVSAPTIDLATGNLTFRTANETFGTATVTFTLRDNGFSVAPHSNTSNTQTVVITVNSLNDPPQFVRGADQVVNEDTGAQSVAGWATDIRPGPAAAIDEIGQTVSFNVSNNNNPLFSVQPALSNTGTLTFTPAPDANGTAVVVVTAVDSGNGTAPNQNSSSQTFTIRVTAVNDAPQFSRGPTVSIQEDAGPQTITGWATNIRPGPASAADEAAQQLTFNLSVVSTNGSISFSSLPSINPATGNLTFTTTPNSNGSAVVRVSLSDNGSATLPNVNTSPAQSFTISVAPVNDPPFVANPITDFTVPEDSPNTVIELFPQVFDDSDILTNGDSLSFTFQVNPPSNILNANLNGTRLTLDYRDNQSGVALIIVQALDRNGASANNTFNVTVTPVNDPPIVADDVAVTPRNQQITIPVLANDSDSDGTINTASVLIVSAPNRGSATVNPNGTVTYTPPQNFIGETSFRYTVQDNSGASSSEATVTVKVNEAPVARNDAATTKQGVASTIDVLSNDTDSDGTLDRTSVTITVAPGKGTAIVNPQTGVVTYTPAANQFGNDSFRYRVKDNNGVLSNEATVSLTIEKNFSWQNPGTHSNAKLDVNNDKQITPLDALLVVNYLNNNGPGELSTPSPSFSPPPFLDTNGDGFATAQDALLVINFLNAGGSGEGEGSDVENASLLSLPEHHLLQQPLVRKVLPQLARQPASSVASGSLSRLLVESTNGNYGIGVNQSQSVAISSPVGGDEWDELLEQLAEVTSNSAEQENAIDSALQDLFG